VSQSDCRPRPAPEMISGRCWEVYQVSRDGAAALRTSPAGSGERHGCSYVGATVSGIPGHESRMWVASIPLAAGARCSSASRCGTAAARPPGCVPAIFELAGVSENRRPSIDRGIPNAAVSSMALPVSAVRAAGEIICSNSPARRATSAQAARRSGPPGSPRSSSEIAVPVAHRHLVFTIPKALRGLFQRERALLGLLWRCAYDAVRRACAAYLEDRHAVTGFVASIQTLGSFAANFRPLCDASHKGCHVKRFVM
jgi:hypothetical protein